MSDGLKKLRALIHELFQFDDADLDFGIYRILRLRRQEVERFLEHDLVGRVQRAFAYYKSVDRASEEEALRSTIADLRKYRVPEADIETNAAVVEHKKSIAMAASHEALQDDVFSRLYDFFSRYYDRGDFLSRRNFRGNTYAVPYAGEEVKLHWANADQYYIKSLTRHAHYDFDLAGGLSVRFEVVGGGEERDNTKAAPGLERIYQLDDRAYELPSKKRLVLRFVYRADPIPDHDQAWHLARLAELLGNDNALMAWGSVLLKAPDDGGRTPLAKHFDRFRRSESFDYFIHKDLSAFLRRELDHYLKTEVMHLDDIESQGAPRVEEYLSKIKVLRALAGDIITFLAQIEDFQKRLWQKRKFVLEARWCISMQIVPRDLWPEVVANDAQREAWVRLFAIDKIEKDLTGTVAYSIPLTDAFLEQNPTLVLDTAHFSRDFTDRILASFDDLEEKTLGVLFHAENFQALQLIQERFRDKLAWIYLDPPYNTTKDEFQYKDGYRHSSWIQMMVDRLTLCRAVQRPDAYIFSSINDIEQPYLRLVFDTVFGAESFVANCVWKSDGNIDNQARVKRNHEYVLVYEGAPGAAPKPPVRDPSIKDDSKLLKEKIENTIVKNGPKNPVSAVVLPAGFPADFEAGTISANRATDQWPKYDRDAVVHDGKLQNDVVIRSGWSSRELLEEFISNTFKPVSDAEGRPTSFVLRQTGAVWLQKLRSDNQSHVLTVIREVGSVQESSSTLSSMGLAFKYAKPLELLKYLCRWWAAEDGYWADFFGGSGGTAQAVLECNAADGGKRKFLLVEAADHFENVLFPRIMKTMRARSWDGGRPSGQIEGSIGIVQVLRLESYADTIDNLVMAQPKELGPLFEKEPDFARDYVLRYMLENETRESPSLLGLSAFERPFSRTLHVTRDDISVASPVDLVETFHWLLGMTVRTRRIDGAVRISRGKLPDGAETVVVWRDPAEVDAEALEAWFETKLLPTLNGVSVVYVNGDQQVERLRPENAGWRVERIDQVFLAKMFPAQA